MVGEVDNKPVHQEVGEEEEESWRRSSGPGEVASGFPVRDVCVVRPSEVGGPCPYG